VGSLYTDHILPRGEPLEGNMSVPVDLLRPILPDLLRYGRPLKPARPWLGVFVSELDENLVVAGVYTRAPAAASLRTGDVILSVGGRPVSDLAGLFRTIWNCGEAGVDVPLTIEREQTVREVRVHSVDRRDFWHKPALH
jgi:S1-C subfamily serine protease